jgi:aminoglycoside phosphotransferase
VKDFKNNEITEGLVSKLAKGLEIAAKKIRISKNSNSITADLDNKFIFKFPLDQDGLEAMIFEHKMLGFLAKKNLPVYVPRPKVHLKKNIAFLYYKKIPGNCVYEEYLAPKTPVEIRKSKLYQPKDLIAEKALALSIAQFLAKIHSIKAKEVSAKVKFIRPFKNFNSEAIRRTIANHLDEELILWFEGSDRKYQKLLAEKRLGDEVFGHFDLHGQNMIIDKSGTLNGVIDFTFANIGNYHYDLCQINSISPRIGKMTSEDYQKITGRKVNQEVINLYNTMLNFDLIKNAILTGKHFDFRYRALVQWYRYLKINERAIHHNVFPYEWRVWLAENIAMRVDQEAIIKTAMRHGFERSDLVRELFRIKSSPIFEGTKKGLVQQRR